MTRKIKTDKKEFLKQPDEFISLSARAIGYIRSHEKVVIAATVAVIVLVIGVSFGTYYIKSNDALAFTALARAIGSETEAGKKKDELIRIRGTRFTSASKYAALYLAQIYAAENQFDKARAEVQTALSINDPFIAGAARVLMTDLLAAEKKYDDALTMARQYAPQLKPPFREDLLYRQAKLEEVKNNQIEARKIYAQIASSAPDFYLTRLVKEKSVD